ncbi:S-DNA-T family DNA segregation ATPase FtsK/SpoIIIE [Rhodococcus sp. AG1013]|uniref:type VII secretion protein EccCa n=1 Tax=Rhodococcus sp. AG1013 TaxID=2183996 RepID=UPI000E0BA84C|nr:type VII secretion protein EccCa [Rhodococcus sp. AG1013]RDI34003.1 S-DNA-T family DNA segregation ATPase FtsK/SpoIIIE [Rhodococcus sp. AG1013]
MGTAHFVRKARREAPRTPGGEVSLQTPPEIPRITPGNLVTKLLPLVMVAAMVGMVALMFTSGMSANPMSLLFPVMMMVSMLGMLAGSGRGGGAKAAEANEERKDYLRYLDQLRRDALDTGRQQRKALEWSHPDPQALWTLSGTGRMWERRITDPDYGHVRVGRGSQRLATRLIPPETGPVEDLEPVSAVSLRRFVRAHSVVPELPTAVSLRGFAAISIDGDRDDARGLVRAMLLQLCTFHGPDHLQIAIVCGPDTAPEWEWAKWLPHAQHPDSLDGVGSARMVYGSVIELESALGPQFSMRGRFSRSAPPTAGVPQIVVVIDGGILDGDSGAVTDGGLDSVTLLDLSGYCPRLTATRGLQLVAADGSLGARGGAGTETFAAVDTLTPQQALSAARRLAPYRIASRAAADVGDDGGAPVAAGWSHLLGLGDIGQFDPARAWVPRQGRDRLRVPIGVGVDGSPVELDLKEAAETGMGPHGLCIGATGSGKSEFLRTLVLGLLATHSPEALNLVLVDFKGGATFLGLDEAPHVAAVITNLAEELAMVDRMKDALAGEMNRRQEVLRAAGNFANVTDYEKARSAGADLAPLPALFIVVDEFSELLSQQPEFADLFVAIGRLGRSLHMHLLLASQRLEEGKLRGLDSHLSYRIGLKTFSANESRTVLGVPDAYHLPASPGAGYLKCDSAEIVRFAASYVSGPYESERVRRSAHAVASTADLRPRVFTAAPVAVPVVDEPIVPIEPEPVWEGETDPRSVLEVLVDRIRGRGPSAHEVWLPPLDIAPTLDRILPPSALTDPVPDVSSLRTPIGVIDRPFDQRRDLLVADLSGATGNVAVVGGPQSGKSTLLRTLIMSMAATHSPQQVQFYCLDFGGGTLSGLAGLPHVGSVANRLDVDLVRRTVAEMATLVRQRERRFRELGIESMAEFRRLRGSAETGAAAVGAAQDPFGDVFLVVDGWPSIRQDFEALEAQISALAGQGLSFGVHVVLATPRWADIRPALKDQLGTRIELRLGDPTDSDVGRAKAMLVPAGRPGRGITRDGLHLLTALPRLDGASRSDDLGAGVANAVARLGVRPGAGSGPAAPRVRMLPDRLSREDLLAAAAGRWPEGSARSGACLAVPIGIDEAELAPVYLDFADQPHFLMFGDSACGKTTLLRGICLGLMESNTPQQAKLIIGDYRRTMLGVVEGDHLAGYAASATTFTTMMNDLAGILASRMPGPDTTQQQLRERSWWSGPEIYVVVDDYDLVATSSGNPLTPLIDYLAHAKDLGLHLIIARRSGGASRALYEPVIARMRDLVPAGMVMSGSRDEGNLLGTVRPSEQPQGRGTFVARSGTSLMQVAWLPPL